MTASWRNNWFFKKISKYFLNFIKCLIFLLKQFFYIRNIFLKYYQIYSKWSFLKMFLLKISLTKSLQRVFTKIIYEQALNLIYYFKWFYILLKLFFEVLLKISFFYEKFLEHAKVLVTLLESFLNVLQVMWDDRLFKKLGLLK